MAGEPEDDDVLDLELEDVIEDEEQTETPEHPEEAPADGDDVVIAFEGDEEEQEKPAESSTIRDLRKRLAEANKKLAANPAPKIEVGPKPDLWEDCDGDPDKFEAAIRAYDKRKADAEAQEADANKAQEAAVAEFETEHTIYREQKAKLNRPDFEAAEIAIETTMTQAQQSVLLLAAKQKAPLIYAVGKNPKRLAELAKITNPIKLAVAVNELERSLKVTPRKGVEPEERQRGNGSISTSARDKEIERLEKKAGQGGDVTATLKRLRELKAK